MKNAIIAIDPGNMSGIAVVSCEPPFEVLLTRKFDFKKNYDLSFYMSNLIDAVFSNYNKLIETKAVIEDQYVGLNPRSTIQLAHNAGRWEQTCIYNAINHVEYLNPKKWQSAMLKGLINKRSKREDIAKAAAFKVGQIYKSGLSDHENDAVLMGRYIAERDAYKKRLK